MEMSNNKVMPEVQNKVERGVFDETRKVSLNKLDQHEDIKTENEKSHGKLDISPDVNKRDTIFEE